jgi:hypothetical protein
MNLIAKVTLVVALLLLAGLGWLAYYAANAPYFTEVGVAKAQMVPFSHQQHVGGLGLDCRYCHTWVEESNTASIPSTATCMGCHTQVAPDSPALEPVRHSLEENKPLEWLRVHDLADYVYFNHAIHVKQGVSCQSCHGRIDQMAVVAKAHSLYMAWCLECHRAPERFIRPRNAVFRMGWQPPAGTDPTTLGKALVAEYGIHVNQLTNCSICHR